MEERDRPIKTIKNEQKIETFLKSLRSGVSVLKASKAANIDYSTIWKWRNWNKEFDDEVLAIINARTQIVVDALFMNAASGNVVAQIFWLKNRGADRWSDRHKHDVEGGIDVLVRYAGEEKKDGNGKKV